VQTDTIDFLKILDKFSIYSNYDRYAQ